MFIASSQLHIPPSEWEHLTVGETHDLIAQCKAIVAESEKAQIDAVREAAGRGIT